ncbi:MAG TPA: LuxR C-terminal-related transcriptional regulator [Nannocystaceae bacterium]|nr:LuxR C-terminal-related transcriptional regulator [Nannocystaceae bacterium]
MPRALTLTDEQFAGRLATMVGTIVWLGQETAFYVRIGHALGRWTPSFTIRRCTPLDPEMVDPIAGVLLTTGADDEGADAMQQLLGPPWYCCTLAVLPAAEWDPALAIELRRHGAHDVVPVLQDGSTTSILAALLRVVSATFAFRSTLVAIDRDERPTLVTHVPEPREARDFEPVRARAEEAGLTPRETDVYLLLSAGLQGKEIAARLLISPNTVKRHSREACRKLGVNTMKAALAGLIARDTPSRVRVPARRLT